MIVAYILFAIAVFITVVAAKYVRNESYDVGSAIVLTVGAFLISFGIVFLVGIIPIGEVTYTDEIVDTKELRALNDKVTTEGHIGGSFIAFSGYINNVPIYAYYYKDDNNAIKYNQVEADKTDIYLISENETPKIETFERTYQRVILGSFPDVFPVEVDAHYKLYVHDGSIATDITFDLK